MSHPDGDITSTSAGLGHQWADLDEVAELRMRAEAVMQRLNRLADLLARTTHDQSVGEVSAGDVPAAPQVHSRVP